MIAFGCVTTDDRRFKAGAARAIDALAEPDSVLLRRHDPVAVGAPCNDILDRVAERDALEAFVLLAEDVSLKGDGFLAKVRRVLAGDRDIAAIVAADRASVDRSLLGGGLLVLSPAAVKELRFDAALEVPLDCAVADVCHEAHARGRRVVASDVGVLRPVQCRRLGDRGRLVRGTVAVQRKWAGRNVPAPC